MLEKHVIDRAAEIVARCRGAGLMVATVESCTGGLVSAVLTAVPGSSDVVDRGLVTYSNEAKTALADVPPALIEAYGAVSAEVAAAMARGGLARSNAQIAVAVTGIAGPGGGTRDKPVGLVHFACAREGRDVALHREVFRGDRAAVRQASVLRALDMIEGAAG
jgi:nicotinamide-nucleotide amidase